MLLLALKVGSIFLMLFILFWNGKIFQVSFLRAFLFGLRLEIIVMVFVFPEDAFAIVKKPDMGFRDFMLFFFNLYVATGGCGLAVQMNYLLSPVPPLYLPKDLAAPCFSTVSACFDVYLLFLPGFGGHPVHIYQV